MFKNVWNIYKAYLFIFKHEQLQMPLSFQKTTHHQKNLMFPSNVLGLFLLASISTDLLDMNMDLLKI